MKVTISQLKGMVEQAILDEKKKKKKKKKKKGGKKDACYHKVKSRYDVWPSAYASGALVKCRKVGAKNWGNSKKEGIEDDYLRQLVEEEVSKLSEADSEGLRKWFGRKGAPGKKRVGQIATLVVKTKKQAKRSVAPVVVRVAKNEQNIRSAVQHHQLVAKKATTAKNQRQVKKDEKIIKRMATVFKRGRY